MRLRLFAACAAVLCLSGAAHADGLGTPVTGVLYFGGRPVNYFDPANGFVPAMYGNSSGITTTIGSGTEFGYRSASNTDTANFTAFTLTVTDVVRSPAADFEMDFTDPAFNSFLLTSASSGFSSSFSDHTLRVFFSGANVADTYTANFSYTTLASTPEPSSLVLLSTGLCAVAAAGRRRLLGLSRSSCGHS